MGEEPGPVHVPTKQIDGTIKLQVGWSILDKIPNKTDLLNQDTDFWMKSDFLSDLSPYLKGRVITRCNELIGNEQDLRSFCDCWKTELYTQLDDDVTLQT